MSIPSFSPEKLGSVSQSGGQILRMNRKINSAHNLKISYPRNRLLILQTKLKFLSIAAKKKGKKN